MTVPGDPAISTDRLRCPRRRFEDQVQATPSRVACVDSPGGHELSFTELDARANQIAHALSERDVNNESLVAIQLERAPELVQAVLATMKLRAGYFILPRNRSREDIVFLLEDAGAELLITNQAHIERNELEENDDWTILALDRDQDLIDRQTTDNTEYAPQLDDLACVEYSFEGAEPEGAMIELHELMKAYDALDERLELPNAGTWLATSGMATATLLDVLLPLTQGLTVVFSDEQRAVRTRLPQRHMDFGLYFFASHEGADEARDKYRLILEASKFGDEAGFSSVWSPERHFHAFGGLSPNPSLLASAIAVQTTNVQLRSGSCVAPLHHPLRIAEEWSVVDNLSGGRAALGVATGWAPNDFVLAHPGTYERRKDVLFETIDTVRRLWRGEEMPFENPMGDTVNLHIVPPPLQKELPMWIAIAGNPDSYRMAGEQGLNVLTHLLGQSLEQLEVNVQTYRRAWQDAGHEGRGTVSLMLHTFVGATDDEVYELVRGPMKEYLGSSVNLASSYVKSFPIYQDDFDVDVKSLSEDEVDAVLEHSFKRYFRNSGLLGTLETCMRQVDRFKELDVDDMACLVDFGVATDTVLESLPRLDELRQLANKAPGDDTRDPIIESIERHSVSHLACSPDIAARLLEDSSARATLSKLATLVVDSEQYAPNLIAQLREHTTAEIVDQSTRESSDTSAATPTQTGSELERAIMEIWSEILSNDEIGLDDNFFDLGGHSLLTVRVQAEIEQKLGPKVPLTDLFRFPTIRSLAEFMGGEKKDDKVGAGVTGDQRAQRRREAAKRRARKRR